MLHRHSNLSPELFASRVAACATIERALSTCNDAVTSASDRLRNERGRAGVTDLGSTHGDGDDSVTDGEDTQQRG
jgi:hypothetical protein